MPPPQSTLDGFPRLLCSLSIPLSQRAVTPVLAPPWLSLHITSKSRQVAASATSGCVAKVPSKGPKTITAKPGLLLYLSPYLVADSRPFLGNLLLTSPLLRHRRVHKLLGTQLHTKTPAQASESPCPSTTAQPQPRPTLGLRPSLSIRSLGMRAPEQDDVFPVCFLKQAATAVGLLLESIVYPWYSFAQVWVVRSG